jgi:hypothetical protein
LPHSPVLLIFASHSVGRKDASRLTCALLEVVFGQETRFTSRVTHEDSALLRRLYIRLEVASDTVTDRHETEFLLVKDVSVLGCQLKELFRQAVVILLLLHRVVESRVAKVLFAVRNQKGFEL